MSEYKVGTISEILAKELGGRGVQKRDPKLDALFSGEDASSKVFRTLKVNENQIFKSKKLAVGGVPNPEIDVRKVIKKEREIDIPLKNKDAAEIRVSAKKNVKIGIEDVSRTTDSGIKKKKNKKKLKKKVDSVQIETISSTTTTTPENDTGGSAEEDKKKGKKKRRSLSGTDESEDKQVKKFKLDTDNGEEGNPTKKPKSVKKKKKNKKGVKGTIGKSEKVVVEEKIKEEVIRDADGNNDTDEVPEVAESNDTAAALKTLAEKNAPKPKDPEQEARTLFVGNLPGDVGKKELKKLFKKFGSIETVRLRGAAPSKPTQLKKVAVNKKELHSDKNTLSGYIRFATREDAENAVTKGRGLVLKENHLVLDLADQGKKRDNKKAIFVGNLNLKITDEELWRFFEDCGTITSVRVIRDNGTGMGKGFGYVNFEEKEAVDTALGKNQQELRKRQVRISRCVKKPKVKKVLGTIKKHGTWVSKKTGEGGKGKIKREKGRKQNESLEYGGDRLAEIGKLKRKSNKPNRGEQHKTRIAKFLTGKAPPKAISSSQALKSRAASKNLYARNQRKRS